MDKNFQQSLRINILEFLYYPKNQKIKKTISFADIYSQLKTLYSLSPQKIDKDIVKEGLNFLLERSMCDVTMVGDVEMYYLTDKGRDVLKRLADGDETVVV